jgi:hypothetical protein
MNWNIMTAMARPDTSDFSDDVRRKISRCPKRFLTQVRTDGGL